MNWKIFNEKKLIAKFKVIVMSILIVIIYALFDVRLLHKSPCALHYNALINKDGSTR